MHERAGSQIMIGMRSESRIPHARQAIAARKVLSKRTGVVNVPLHASGSRLQPFHNGLKIFCGYWIGLERKSPTSRHGNDL